MFVKKIGEKLQTCNTKPSKSHFCGPHQSSFDDTVIFFVPWCLVLPPKRQVLENVFIILDATFQPEKNDAREQFFKRVLFLENFCPADHAPAAAENMAPPASRSSCKTQSPAFEYSERRAESRFFNKFSILPCVQDD
jgi:hypothetical protein